MQPLPLLNRLAARANLSLTVLESVVYLACQQFYLEAKLSADGKVSVDGKNE